MVTMGTVLQLLVFHFVHVLIAMSIDGCNKHKKPAFTVSDRKTIVTWTPSFRMELGYLTRLIPHSMGR